MESAFICANINMNIRQDTACVWISHRMCVCVCMCVFVFVRVSVTVFVCVCFSQLLHIDDSSDVSEQ